MLPKRGCSEHGCKDVAALGSSRCPTHMRAVQRSYDDRRGTTVERGYDEHHERLRVLCFQRDEWRCRECGWEPDVVQQCRLANIEAPPADVVLEELRQAKNAGERHLHADHVAPISGRNDPRRLDLDNVQTLCDWCHRRKTFKENGMRAVPWMAAPAPDR